MEANTAETINNRDLLFASNQMNLYNNLIKVEFLLQQAHHGIFLIVPQF